jgi:hypothetical protein
MTTEETEFNKKLLTSLSFVAMWFTLEHKLDLAEQIKKEQYRIMEETPSPTDLIQLVTERLKQSFTDTPCFNEWMDSEHGSVNENWNDHLEQMLKDNKYYIFSAAEASQILQALKK